MAHKENQRIALTKKLLQEGLLHLLETKSLDRISVTELCRESGINRATFYNHFNSPQDLLDSIEAKLTNELNKVIETPITVIDVHTETEAVCNFFYENARTILILHNCNADNGLSNALYRLNLEYQSVRLRAKYPNLINEDGFHLIAVFFYNGLYSILLEWLDTGLVATPKQIADLMIALARENFVE